MMFEDEIEDSPELQNMSQNPDDMMVDAMAQEEEEEMDALLSMFEAQSRPFQSFQPFQPQQQQQPVGSPSYSALADDDDYDSIFRDLMSGQVDNRSSQGFASSGQMDMS